MRWLNMDIPQITSRIVLWVAAAAGLTLIWLVYSIVYNLLLSPLSRFPGPKLRAITNIPSQLSLLRGYTHLDVTALHERYGPVVRIRPNELAFSTAQAFRDIYGPRPGGCFPKDPTQYMAPANGVQSLAGAVDDQAHTRQKRLLSTAFSDRALRDQEDLIRSYVDALIGKLRNEINKESGSVDIKTWMNCATFDISSHLMFGESFDCLKDSTLHPWIEAIFKSIKAFAFVLVIYDLPVLPVLLEKLVPESVKQKMHDHFNFTAERADRRLGKGVTGSDFMSAILQNGLSEIPGAYHGKDKIMSRDEIHSNASIIIMAGSETSATLLSGCIFYLCRHPDIMRRLVEEIRSTFTADNEITFHETAKLTYLAAVVEESLRKYPPVATSNGRVVPRGGATIDGSFVPENTTVSCHHYASYHSSSNFALPNHFIPERWLGTDTDTDPRFESDNRDVLQPFLLGPRSCLGKSLAYSEIRLILCKLLFNFDIQLCPESVDWIDNQKVYFLWDKPALMVTLTDRLSK